MLRKSELALWTGAFLLLLPAVRLHAMTVERADYVITVPEKSTVDPADADIDLDHMTTINLPNENSVNVLVIDDKTKTDVAYQAAKKSYLGQLTDVKESPSQLFEKQKGVGVKLAGTAKGTAICFELGWFAGNKKGFIVVTFYTPDEVKTAVPIAQEVINSIKIKEAAAK